MVRVWVGATPPAWPVVVIGLLMGLLGGLAVGLGAAASAAPATFYVSMSGKDSADGSQRHPWRTIAKATATAPAGSTILVGGGRYDPFVITQRGQTVTAQPREQVVVRGNASVRDVIRVASSGATVSGLQVTGCVPNASPPGGFEESGSSAVRIDDGTTGVRLSDLLIRGGTGTNSQGLPFGCFGVFAHDADGFTVQDSDISGTGTGIYVNGGGRQAMVQDNDIHDNNVLIRDTRGGDDDFGANGVSVSNVVAAPGVTATGNAVTGNVGRSADYGTDGGAFEIYNASNTQILDNTMSDNDDVLETGASPNGGACVGNVFSDNQASGRTSGSGVDRSLGLVLRCATGMQVEDNTFDHLDQYVYDIDASDRFSTDVRGMSITGNTVEQSDPVYRLAVDPSANRLDVDRNRSRRPGPSSPSTARAPAARPSRTGSGAPAWTCTAGTDGTRSNLPAYARTAGRSGVPTLSQERRW